MRTWAADRRGVVALLTGFLALPLTIGVGACIDYAQLIECQTTLQDAVDNAALAGATVYSASTDNSGAVTVATQYIGTAPLPATMKLGTPTVTAASGTTNFSGNAYNVTVTATATVTLNMLPTRFGAITIAATATASNPIVALKLNVGKFTSSAADWDAIYMYGVPMSNGQPVYTSVPGGSGLYEIGSNCNKAAGTNNYSSNSMCAGQSGATVPTGQTLPTLTSNQPMAFILENMTWGLYTSGQTTSTNGYGAQPGHTNIFYSAYGPLGGPPSQNANYSYNVTTKSGTKTTTTTVTTTYPTASSSLPNCSLLVQPLSGTTVPTSPPLSGSCYTLTNTATGYQYATVTCATMNGRTFAFWWNDMGGGSDDKDYNDSTYTIACTPGSGSATGNSEVVLTQ